METTKKQGCGFNIFSQCRRYRIKLWQCPQFLFIIMGVVIIAAILLSNIAARYYTEPEIAALIVLAVTAFLFVVGHTIVASFQKMAETVIEKSEFVSIVSHQLRSPLSAIRWQVELIAGKYKEAGDEGFKASLDIIEDQNARMMRIVNDMLELNFIESNNLNLNPRPFSLKELAERVMGEYKTVASASNIELNLISPSNFPPVLADQEKIKSVMRHIVDNAIRYGKGRGEVMLTIEKINASLKLSVADQGLGISKDDSRRIFTKFFRSASAPRYQTEGSGIGLYLAKAIIEASGGKIGFKSMEGKGSTFWFALPLSGKK